MLGWLQQSFGHRAGGEVPVPVVTTVAKCPRTFAPLFPLSLHQVRLWQN